MLLLFQHHFGITDKSRKSRFFHRFSYFWPWSRNNDVMIQTTWYFPVNFTPKNYASKLNFKKKKILFLKRVSGSVVTTILGCLTEFLFFSGKKGDHNVFWGGIHWRLPWCCNYANIVSGSQTKVEKTDFFFIFTTFDRDPKIVMQWIRRHGNSR